MSSTKVIDGSGHWVRVRRRRKHKATLRDIDPSRAFLVIIVAFIVAVGFAAFLACNRVADLATDVAAYDGCHYRATYNLVAGHPVDAPTEPEEALAECLPYWPQATGFLFALRAGTL